MALDDTTAELQRQFPKQSFDVVKTLILAYHGNIHNATEALKGMNDPNYKPDIDPESLKEQPAHSVDSRFSYLGAMHAAQIVGHSANNPPRKSTSNSRSRSRSRAPGAPALGVTVSPEDVDEKDAAALHTEFPKQSLDAVKSIFLAYSGNTANAREALKGMNDKAYQPRINLDAVRDAEPRLQHSGFIAPLVDHRFSYVGALHAQQIVGPGPDYHERTAVGDGGVLSSLVEKARSRSRSRSRSRGRGEGNAERSSSKSRFNILKPFQESEERGRQ